jgi:hypothetical protein
MSDNVVNVDIQWHKTEETPFYPDGADWDGNVYAFDPDDGKVHVIHSYGANNWTYWAPKRTPKPNPPIPVPKTHNLKIYPQYFEEVLTGNKTFEIRRNDRNFLVGDTVVLQEFNRGVGEYTGREIEVIITYISDYEQKPEYVVFSFVVA